MHKGNKRKLVGVLVGGVVALALAGGALFAATGIVGAAKLTADDLGAITQASVPPGLMGDGYLARGGRWGGPGFGTSIDYTQLLADALGKSADDVKAAYQEAQTTAIQQAVAEGLINQEQADDMMVWGGMSRRGFGFLPFGRGPKGMDAGEIDEEALLADALGVTVDELQAAREKANQAALEQAVAEGVITQEQADEMLAHRDLMSYLDRDTLLAETLGMTVDELKAAYDEGSTLSSLMAEAGLDATTVRAKLVDAHNNALAKAVADGVITQEQADDMENRPGLGLIPGGRFMPGDMGEFGCRGGFRGRRGGMMDNGTDSDIGFRMQGRFLKGDDSL